MSDTCYKCGGEFVEGKVSATTGLCQKCSERTDKPIDDGGPAFPFGQISEATGQPINGFFSPGMTLRDWFAGMALQGFTANPDTCAALSHEDAAKASYATADAMLKAREAK